MAVIKKIGVMSLAKIEGIIGAVVGLILGLLTAIMGIAIGGVAGAGFGLFSIIVFPIMYGIMLFITGAIGAFLYNLAAGWVGGIEIEI